jgi:hypothetical protein
MDIQTTLDQFNAGMFMQQFELALAETSKAALAYARKGKPGKVNLSITILPIEEGDPTYDEDDRRFNVEHTWSYEQPEKRGKSTRIHSTITPMYITPAGGLLLFPNEEPSEARKSPSSNVTSIKG